LDKNKEIELLISDNLLDEETKIKKYNFTEKIKIDVLYPEKKNFFISANTTEEQKKKINKTTKLKKNLLDPISNKVIKKSVRICKKHFFDKESLEQHLQKSNSNFCPLCNKELQQQQQKKNRFTNKYLEDDEVLQEQINEVKKKKIDKILKLVNDFLSKKESLLYCFKLIFFAINLFINDEKINKILEEKLIQIILLIINFKSEFELSLIKPNSNNNSNNNVLNNLKNNLNDNNNNLNNGNRILSPTENKNNLNLNFNKKDNITNINTENTIINTNNNPINNTNVSLNTNISNNNNLNLTINNNNNIINNNINLNNIITTLVNHTNGNKINNLNNNEQKKFIDPNEFLKIENSFKNISELKNLFFFENNKELKIIEKGGYIFNLLLKENEITEISLENFEDLDIDINYTNY
jgi:hypothetical protein